MNRGAPDGTHDAAGVGEFDDAVYPVGGLDEAPDLLGSHGIDFALRSDHHDGGRCEQNFALPGFSDLDEPFVTLPGKDGHMLDEGNRVAAAAPLVGLERQRGANHVASS
jgi:hypothetical protein